MFSRVSSVLLVLLVLGCLQSYTAALNAKEPEKCCFNFFKRPIPVRVIRSYEVTRDDCPKGGIIFSTAKGDRVCVDPGFKWVNRAVDMIDQRLFESST